METVLLALAGLAAVVLLARGLRLQNFNPGSAYAAATPTPIAISTGNVAAGTLTATLPGVAGKTTYIEGFDLAGGGNSAAPATIVGTVTGLPTAIGTLTFDAAILGTVLGPAFGAGGSQYSIRFPTPLPASAANTAIVVTFPSFGAGNTQSSLTAYGYQA